MFLIFLLLLLGLSIGYLLVLFVKLYATAHRIKVTTGFALTVLLLPVHILMSSVLIYREGLIP